MSNAQTLGQIASDRIQQRTGIYVNPALLKAQLQHETGNFAMIDDALKGCRFELMMNNHRSSVVFLIFFIQNKNKSDLIFSKKSIK